MTNLIRFHEWIIDRDEIQYVEIKKAEEKESEDKFDDIKHNLIIHMKNEKKFILICYSLYNAQIELNNLTITSKANFRGTEYQHFLTSEIRDVYREVSRLSIEVRKLMASYKT